MQTRFVSLRVTETWQMVEGRNPNTAAPAAPSPAQVAPQAAHSPRELEPTAAREPFQVN